MSVVGLQPITLKDATLTVAEDDFTAAIGQVMFVPQVQWSWTEADICSPFSYPVYEGIRWTVTVGYAQDWVTPGSLSRYLIEHAAQTRTVTFVPNNDPDVHAVQADVMIVPGQYGGVPNQHLTATVTMPCFEEPRLGTWTDLQQEASHALG